MKLIASLILLIALTSAFKLADLPRKKLAGPASEFNTYKLPSPSDAAVLEDSALQMVTLSQKAASALLEWSTPVVVDNTDEFTISVFIKTDEKLVFKLVDPNGQEVNLNKFAFQGHFPIGSDSIPETTYRFENPAKGTWTFTITTKNPVVGHKLNKMMADSVHGAVIIWNKSPVRAFSHLNTYNLITGNQIGLVTELTEKSRGVAGSRPEALREVISSAEMDIILPDGQEVDVEMHDDGLHGDLGANDGIYGAHITATEAGVYRATAVVKGVHSDGTNFYRTTQHLIPVVEDTLDLVENAIVNMADKKTVTIYVQVKSNSDASTLYRAFSEVWGKDESGNDVAVCWVGGMVNVEEYEGNTYIALELNADWLSYANAKAPLTLKNVVVQETSSYIPIAEQAQISVTMPSAVVKYLNNIQNNVTEITPEMRRGKLTGLQYIKKSNATASAPTLMIVHGYCSSSNPWLVNANDFTNAAFFLDSSANKNNEEFAALVAKFAIDNGMTSFGYIGHSQGGMVGAHLLNYFETGLDYATGGARIQSVGTPFLGCSAAGSAASLGKSFGVGCGANTDLATDGAKLWSAGITKETQMEISMYTTTYEQGKFFGDYCNMAMNAILEWPNDGTTEIENALLPYGKYMGNTEKQCHTTGMKYTAQYEDKARNKALNANASR